LSMDEVISSSSNRWVVLAKELATSAKARKLHGLAFIEGIHTCQSLILSHIGLPQEHEALLVGASYVTHPEVLAIVRAWKGRTVVMTDKLFASISQVQNGVPIAIFSVIPTIDESALERALAGDVVYLDGLQDPGNVGTIIRSAAAAGIHCLVAAPSTVSLWSPKVLRSAMGAHFGVQLIENLSVAELMAKISSSQTCFVTSGQASKSLFETDLRPSAIWVLGNEGQGVGLQSYQHLAAQSQVALKLVKIPIRTVESLNVATAAAVCFFEQWRQRQANQANS
jgi:RNA methyltransferase, TrmH family